MRSSLILITAILAAAPAVALQTSATKAPANIERAEPARADETPAQRVQRLTNDRLHSKARANETPAQRAQRLAADKQHSMAVERNEVPTPADAIADQKRLADDRLHSTARAHETPAQRARRLADDKARSMAKKDHQG